MAADRDGTGYWLVAADGGIFAFNAPYAGTSTNHSGTIIGITTTPNGYLIGSSRGQLSEHTTNR